MNKMPDTETSDSLIHQMNVLPLFLPVMGLSKAGYKKTVFWKYYAKYPPLEKNSKVLPERFPYPICHIGKKNHLWSPCTGDPLDPSKKMH